MRSVRASAAFLAVACLLSWRAVADSDAGVPLPSERPQAEFASLASVERAEGYHVAFSGAGPDLAAFRWNASPVPRAFAHALPPDIGSLHSVADRKRVFLEIMLPLLLEANERIVAARARIRSAGARLAAGAALSPAEADWLDGMMALYRTADGGIGELLHRVDVIPVSLALAQSAIESGWGTSRFALEGHAVFGQRSWDRHDGIVPRRREAGESHVVKSFTNLGDAVAAYVVNLNRHEAYAAFRDLRAELRTRGYPLDGRVLATTLGGYAEEPDYVDHVLLVIRHNRLADFDDARLAGLSA